MREAIHMEEPFAATTLEESASARSDEDACVESSLIPAGERTDRGRVPGTDVPDRRSSKATRPSTRCSSTRVEHRGALQRGGYGALSRDAFISPRARNSCPTTAT